MAAEPAIEAISTPQSSKPGSSLKIALRPEATLGELEAALDPHPSQSGEGRL
jgi:hypothetical protein